MNIRKVLQREANTGLLAVCPPPSGGKLVMKKRRGGGGGQNAKKYV
jgi:hypothetical protein